MAFSCGNCNSTFSDSKMVGIVVGQIGRDLVNRELGLPKSSNFSGRELTAGILSGFNIKCPKCGKSNWND